MSKNRPTKTPKVTKIPRPDSSVTSTSSTLPGGITVEEITLTQPTRSRPSGTKTLIDIIADNQPNPPSGSRKTASGKKKPQETKDPHDWIELEESSAEEENEESETDEIQVVGPIAQTFFYSVPMATLLFALDLVVHQQYRQEITYTLILSRVLKAFPIIYFLLYTLHPRRLHPLTQSFFLLVSVTCGCWLVHAVNRKGYYAVMKKAPPVGTLWIWAAVEMELPWLLVSCGVVGGYVWWGGYNIV